MTTRSNSPPSLRSPPDPGAVDWAAPGQRPVSYQTHDLLDTPLQTLAGDDAVKAVLLAQAVQYEIIPRLMLAHRVTSACREQVGERSPAVHAADVAVLAELVLHEDDARVNGCVMALQDRGVSVDAILLHLLPPVARHVGAMWERDLCNFSEVTVALGRLQKILRDLRPLSRCSTHGGDTGLRVLLMPSPGEQHTFGLSLVADCFERAGWDVDTCFMAVPGAEDRVRTTWYDVVGFSLGSAAGLEALHKAIARVRAMSQNHGVPIICGGPLFVLDPAYAHDVDADALVTDAAQAPLVAQQLVATRRTVV